MKARLLAAASATALIGCGSDPYCGDGETDPGEQCDDGNADDTDFCRACEVYLPPRTVVKWRFNAESAEGFNQDSCNDVGARAVRVELRTEQGGPIVATAEDMCSTFQVVFEELVPGPYFADVWPVDGDGNQLVVDPARQQVTATAGDTEHTINVPPDYWIADYTGTFFFTIRWAGLDCPVAVTKNKITLTVGGQVVSQQTMTGQRLDGSQPGPCVPASNPSPQSALLVPFGLATIEIVGMDDTDAEHYRGSFETFVGAGPSNPTLDYDVPAVDAAPL